MRLEALRREVLEANLELIRRNLVIYTFGNASGISREDGLVAIKPSGVPFDELTPESMVLTDLDGRVVEGGLRPSSDLDTHIVLYKAFPGIGAVVHTHSRYATSWARPGRAGGPGAMRRARDPDASGVSSIHGTRMSCIRRDRSRVGPRSVGLPRAPGTRPTSRTGGETDPRAPSRPAST